jgi:signal recognition particle receptor subunit beta
MRYVGLVVQVDFASREIAVKLVYCGPAQSGKTTNLSVLRDAAAEDTVGRLMTLETKDEQTLFFDLLPMTFQAARDLSVRLQLFSVPGQTVHASTRRLVVKGADGIVFVADSRVSRVDDNAASLGDLREHLASCGTRLDELPLVIQFNKRDLPEVRTHEELCELARRGREPVYAATATRGVGVVETFLGILEIAWLRLEERHSLHEKFGLDVASLLDHVAHKLGRSDGVRSARQARLGAPLVAG